MAAPDRRRTSAAPTWLSPVYQSVTVGPKLIAVKRWRHMYNASSSNPVVIGCTFTDNHAHGDSGAMATNDSNPNRRGLHVQR